jgi:required for meiotic nuclear division protein 1
MRKIFAYQIAESIDLRQFRKSYSGKEYFANSSEVFYIGDDERFLYIFSYGVVVFLNYEEEQTSELIAFSKPFCKNILSEKMWDEFIVHDNASHDKFGFNEIHLSRFDPDVMRIVMLNVGQSAALDYYSQQASLMLESTKIHTLELERSGKIHISNKQLMHLIGKTMNVKNSIVENLYIIDSPDETWDDEYLNKIDSVLKNTFDLKDRFRDIDYQIQITKDNLNLFVDMIQTRRSHNLEIIVIVLILFEVIHALLK